MRSFHNLHDSKIFFHLGLKKTGSTYLQQKIFPKLKGIKYYGKKGFKNYKGKLIAYNHENYLFSHEFDSSLERILKEISKDLPQARIILVLRRQDSWVASKYKYHIKKHGYLNFEEFFDLASNTGLWKKEEFYFRKKIEWIEKYFENKPLILIYDDLKTNPDRFITQITDFLDTQIVENTKDNKVINKALSNKQLKVLKKFNKFYPYVKLNSGSKILKRIHHIYRMFLLHTVSFLGQVIPYQWLGKEALIDHEELEKIREHYLADWEYCKQYSRTIAAEHIEVKA